ncbi:Indoleamine 2,3-dioxygenase [Xylogone sp. PMI_703]|nr:Indoleamine 2,3-dioxygenase [Xylogone sp. PMI_703]
MLDSMDISLKEYSVSPVHGFLPENPPLTELSNPYYQPWELIVDNLPFLLKNGLLRQSIDELPQLSTSLLETEPEWRRAYLLLSFMTHAYIWAGPQPSEILPPVIAVPMLAVSSQLGLPPTGTYAAFNLWNFKTTSIDESTQTYPLESLSTLHTFTGTPDEEWFFLISTAIESRGAATIPLMLDAMSAVQSRDTQTLLKSLLKFGDIISECGLILGRMYERCQPDVFYHQIRPFLAGSKNMAVAGLPRGVFYDEGDGKGEWKCFSGGSNAQSSLIQFFDIALGVEHSSATEFLRDMRNYMPKPHRDFLMKTASIANIRSFVQTDPSSSDALLNAYNLAVTRLKEFRNIHIQIVTRYIIGPSRKVPLEKSTGLNLAIASAKENREERKDGLKGTGGTELMPFLKKCRDETTKARLVVYS